MNKKLLQQTLDALENSSDLVFKYVEKSYLRGLAITAIKAAIAQPVQPAAVPGGMCLVPIEPTEAMLCTLMKWDSETGFSILQQYRAMIAPHIAQPVQPANHTGPLSTLELALKALDPGSMPHPEHDSLVLCAIAELKKDIAAQPVPPATIAVAEAIPGVRGPRPFVQPYDTRQFSTLANQAHAFAQPATERNFCERCGKRLGGVESIHTCTPPEANKC